MPLVQNLETRKRRGYFKKVKKMGIPMIDDSNLDSTDGIIATIENEDNPSQVIALKYLPGENAFVTSGIRTHFVEKEILIPAHLLVIDFQLMGAIVTAILEKLSQ